MLSNQVSIHRDRMILLLLSAILILLSPAYGQADKVASTESESAAATETADENSESPTEPVETTPQPESPPNVIPLEEVAVRAQAVLETILVDEAGTERPAILDAIQQGLPTVTSDLDAITREMESIQDSGRIGRRLLRIDDELNAIERQLDEWSNQLVDLTRTYQEDLSDINTAAELWSNTQASVTEQDGSESLLEQIDTVIVAIQKGKDQRIAARDEAVQFQTQVSAAATLLTTVRQKRSDLSRETRHQIFQPDSPTIWDVTQFREQEDGFSEQLSKQMGREFGDIRDYAKRDPLGILLQFVIIVVTAVFLIRVRRQHQDTLKDDPRTKSAAQLLNHPIAAGIVIGLVLTPVLIQGPPLVYYRYAIFAVLIPVFLLLRTTMAERAKASAYLTILLYVILRLSEHLPEFSFGQRTLYLVVSGIGLTATILKIRRNRSQPSEDARVHWFESLTNIVGLSIYSVSMVTNIFGIFALTQRLLLGFVGALTLALILIAGLNAIREHLRIAMVVGPLQHLSAVRYHYSTVDHTIYRILRFLTLLAFTVALLAMFGLYQPAIALLTAILDFGWQIGALKISIGSILTFVLALWLATIASRSVRFVVNSDILPRFDLPRGIPSTISMMLHYGIMTLGILVAMAAAGINLSQLSIVIGALGVGIGFGLQNLVNNFVSGLILIFERPIKVGDKITFGINTGEVRSIGIRASNVRKFDGSEIIVPNGNLISNEVTNWTLSDQQRRMEVIVGVAYGSDPEQVLDLLSKVLGQFDDVLKDPEPFISFDGFGESSLDFTVRFWINDFSLGLRLKSKIAIAVYKALNEAGIEIPFPQRDLHLRSISEEPAKTLGGKAHPEDPA